jgi:hypothetical protein
VGGDHRRYLRHSLASHGEAATGLFARAGFPPPFPAVWSSSEEASSVGHPSAHCDTRSRRTRVNRDGGGMLTLREFQTEPYCFAGQCVGDGFIRTRYLDFPASTRVSAERALLRFMALARLDAAPHHPLLFNRRVRWSLGSMDGHSGRLSRGRDQWRRGCLRLHQASESRLRLNLTLFAF